MTNWVQWFRDQLKASGDGFIWAFEQLPKAYHYKLPPAPKYLGTWPPIRHIWHVTGYERARHPFHAPMTRRTTSDR